MNRRLSLLTLGVLTILVLASVDTRADIQFKMETSKGNVEGVLYPDTAPLSVSNFINLSNRGIYNGVHFHSTLPGNIVQTGDPSGTGTGGLGYSLEPEPSISRSFDEPGIIGIPSENKAVSGSQFFIILAPDKSRDGKSSVIGKVTKGMDIVRKLETSDTIKSITVEAPDWLRALTRTQLEAWNRKLDAPESAWIWLVKKKLK